MIVICHHYKYLKLIKRKAIKLFPQPERCKRIKVCNTSKIVSLDSKITAWFSWLVIAFKLRLAVVVNVIITITYQVFRSLYKPATVPIFELYTVTFKNIFYSHQNMLTTKYRARTFINQFAKLLYEGLWGLTPIGPIKWWCGTSTCWFHIRSFHFYGNNTELSQLPIFHSIIKHHDNILFLCCEVEFQCKVNNNTSTPWDRH